MRNKLEWGDVGISTTEKRPAAIVGVDRIDPQGVTQPSLKGTTRQRGEPVSDGAAEGAKGSWARRSSSCCLV